MHGLICKSIQCFLQETYGKPAWEEITQAAQIGQVHFEAMLTYDPEDLDCILNAAADRLNSEVADILEDLGLFLITHPSMAALRRLLRFGGESFVEFLFSLEELKDRVHMAVADLDFPTLELREHSSSAYSLIVTHPRTGYGRVLVGVLRAIADDYGTLAFMEHGGTQDGVETILVDLIEVEYAEAREFQLVAS